MAHALRFLPSVVSQSFFAFADILQLHTKFLQLSAGINRIFELDDLLDAAQHGHSNGSSLRFKDTESCSDDIISFSKVDIITPTQKMLARQLTFDIASGKSLLVTGPNGSGKSSIFRVLRGLWPVVNGRLVKPHQPIDLESGFHLFCVPQRSSTCLGTLRDQIIYPLSCDEAERRLLHRNKEGQEFISATNMLDAHLKTILQNIKLLYLLEREGGWDTCQNWEDILSLREQQRLGMALLFFHKPRFEILDESTKNSFGMQYKEQY